MSTKIYHGYYTLLSMSDLLKKFNEFGARYRRRVRQAAMRLVVTQFLEYVDCTDFNIPISFDTKKIRKESIIMSTYRMVCEEYKEAEKHGERKFTEQEHWILTASIFPTLPDGRTLMLAFDNTGQNVFGASFNDIVKPYFYYDNTDKPDDIPDDEWEKRKKDWETFLEYGTIVRDVSFTYEFNPAFLDLPMYDELVPHLLDIKTREKLIRAQLPEGAAFDSAKIRKIENVEDIKSVLESFEKAK